MHRSLARAILLGLPLAALAGCATPSRDITAQPGDFALLEIQLQG